MAVTVASFKTRFPSFATVSNSTIEMLLAEAVVILSESYWGVKYDIGVMYYTAHLLALDLNVSAGGYSSVGQVSSRSVDGVSISYNTVSQTGTEAWFASTVFGQRFLELQRNLRIAACVV